MIKINLLPHKRVKAVEKDVIRVRMIAAGVTAVVILGILYQTFALFSRNRELSKEVASTTKRLEELKEKVKEVDSFENTRVQLEDKLKTINSLKKRKIPFALLLGEVNAQMTKEVWLTSLKAYGPSFDLDGMARDNRGNVEIFMERLQGSQTFAEVKLVDSKEDKGRFSFKISGKLAGYEEAMPPAPEPAKGKPVKKKDKKEKKKKK